MRFIKFNIKDFKKKAQNKGEFYKLTLVEFENPTATPRMINFIGPLYPLYNSGVMYLPEDLLEKR
jgi:hypothetical protein